MEKLKFGILTVSDRAHSGEYQDLSGPAVEDCLTEYIKSEWEAICILVPDNYSDVKNGLMKLSDKEGCSLIITTGGTGPAPRDLTPEATEAVCYRILPGFGELMRSESLKFVRTSILSRQIAGIRGTCLIINLPGKPKAIRQCMDAVFPAVPDCVKLIGGGEIEANDNEIKVHH